METTTENKIENQSIDQLLYSRREPGDNIQAQEVVETKKIHYASRQTHQKIYSRRGHRNKSNNYSCINKIIIEMYMRQ